MPLPAENMLTLSCRRMKFFWSNERFEVSNRTLGATSWFQTAVVTTPVSWIVYDCINCVSRRRNVAWVTAARWPLRIRHGRWSLQSWLRVVVIVCCVWTHRHALLLVMYGWRAISIYNSCLQTSKLSYYNTSLVLQNKPGCHGNILIFIFFL